MLTTREWINKQINCSFICSVVALKERCVVVYIFWPCLLGFFFALLSIYSSAFSAYSDHYRKISSSLFVFLFNFLSCFSGSWSLEPERWNHTAGNKMIESDIGNTLWWWISEAFTGLIDSDDSRNGKLLDICVEIVESYVLFFVHLSDKSSLLLLSLLFLWIFVIDKSMWYKNQIFPISSISLINYFSSSRTRGM